MLYLVIDFNATSNRFLYIALTFLMIYTALHLTVLFLVNSIKKRNETLGTIYFAFALLFSGIMIALGIVSANRIFNLSFADHQRILYIVVSLTFLIFIMIIERNYIKLEEFHTKYIFTSVAIILTIFYIFIDPIPNIFIVGILAIIPFLFPLIFVIFLFRQTSGKLKRKMFFLILSVITFYISIILSMEEAVEYIQYEWIIILGMVLMIFSLNGIYLSFKMDVFIEMGWREHLEELVIIKKDTQTTVYYLNLNKLGNKASIKKDSPKDLDLNNQTNSLFSGGIIGINEMLKEITNSAQSKGISLIEQEGKYIMIEHGTDFLTCFVTNRNLNSLRYFLRKIKNAFETYYSANIIDWDKQANSMSSMNPIINRILETKY